VRAVSEVVRTLYGTVKPRIAIDVRQVMLFER